MKQTQDATFLDSPIEITIIRDGRPLMNQTFQHSPIQIGRVLDNDIVLPFDSVSRFHCELRFENKKWTLVDLKSMNGMKVNGQQVASATFETTGEFEIKPVTIRFQIKAAAPVTVGPDDVTKSTTGIVSSSDETLVGPDVRPHRGQHEGKRLHNERSETAEPIRRPTPAAATSTPVHRPMLDLDGVALLADVHPAIEKAKLKAVQVTVTWYEVVLSVDEFCAGEDMIIEINGIFLRLGRVGKDRAEIRCPTGTGFIDRPGSESMLLPNNPACWESSDGIRIMARFVPQSKRLRTGLLPMIEEELVDPLVLSGAIHGVVAIASVTISRPPVEEPIVQPERIARIIQEAPTPVTVAKATPAPTPTPVPVPSATPTPKPVIATKPTPAASPKKKVVLEKKPQPKPMAREEQSVAPKTDRPARIEKPDKVAKSNPPPPGPKASAPPAPTPRPFQASSVGALKALSLLSAAPTVKNDSANTIVVRRSASSAEGGGSGGGDVSTSNLLNQLPVEGGDPNGAVGGLALNVSKGGAGYGTSGYSGKTGKRTVMGSVIGGATYSESTKTEGLTREQVMKIVQKHQGQIQQCYERSLMDDANLAGRAEFEWEISAQGSVTSVSVKESNLRNGEKLLDCVKGVFKKMAFPSAKNGASTTPTIGLPFGRL